MPILPVDAAFEGTPSYRDVRAALRRTAAQLIELVDLCWDTLDRAELEDLARGAQQLHLCADDFRALVDALCARVGGSSAPSDGAGEPVRCTFGCGRTWPAGTDDWGTVHYCTALADRITAWNGASLPPWEGDTPEPEGRTTSATDRFAP